MDDDKEDESPILVTHNRSGNFSHNEIKALVEQIMLHKGTILNKCTNSAANFAKEAAWEKICNEINKKGFKHKRTVGNLKTKWLNLKRLARKVSLNIIDVESTNLDDILNHIVMLINETEIDSCLTMDGSENNTNASITDILQEDSLDANDIEEQKMNNRSSLWDDNSQNQSDESDDAEKVVSKRRRRIRTLNFSPSECSLLLRCVREEKDNILFEGRGNATRAVKIQNDAWDRITMKYNKLSPRKRTNKMLRTKFDNMKRLNNRVKLKKYFYKNKLESHEGKIKHKRLHRNHNEDSIKVKYEFKTEPGPDAIIDKDSDLDNDDYPAEIPLANNYDKLDDNSDPLCMVLNGDSGMESLSHFGSYTPYENKEVEKPKIELLNYQMETAKMERQRIKEALQAESTERQSKAIEQSLRLRAARLEAIAAESKLPSTHPALQYNEQEKLAQHYLQQFDHT